MDNLTVRALSVSITLVASVLVGIGAGVLTWVGGENVAKSVLAGFVAFAGTATFILVIIEFVAAGRSRRR